MILGKVVPGLVADDDRLTSRVSFNRGTLYEP